MNTKSPKLQGSTLGWNLHTQGQCSKPQQKVSKFSLPARPSYRFHLSRGMAPLVMQGRCIWCSTQNAQCTIIHINCWRQMSAGAHGCLPDSAVHHAGCRNDAARAHRGTHRAAHIEKSMHSRLDRMEGGWSAQEAGHGGGGWRVDKGDDLGQHGEHEGAHEQGAHAGGRDAQRQVVARARRRRRQRRRHRPLPRLLHAFAMASTWTSEGAKEAIAAWITQASGRHLTLDMPSTSQSVQGRSGTPYSASTHTRGRR